MSRTFRTLAAAITVVLVTAGSSAAAFIVTSKDIKDGTIQLVDISGHAKKALRGKRAFSTVIDVQGRRATLCSAGRVCSAGTSTAVCPAGTVPIAGGWRALLDDATVVENRRSSTSNWSVTIANNSPSSGGFFNATAVCAR
jgi:hypothetical protein